MEATIVINTWQLIIGIITFVGSFSINTFMTTRNSKKIEDFEEKIVDVVKWDKARATFVSKELYANQMEHIDLALGELKKQNEAILSYVAKDK
ncbi:MAG: hypothetical protein C0625_02095 [Arcobacter sp.]|nr:MAG: hypothetical protein C0625_02095 [Arcobacter sp.]